MDICATTPARTVLVAAATFTLVGSMLGSGSANAADSRISAAEMATIRTAMTDAGVDAETQDALIARRQAGDPSDSEDSDARPVSTADTALPGGGTARVETFADGSQRTTSLVPITTFTTIECNLVHCTVLMSRAQTKQMASGSAGAGAIITALCGPAAWACAIAVGLMVDNANRAVSQGKCAGIRKFVTAAPVWPIIEPCRQ